MDKKSRIDSFNELYHKYKVVGVVVAGVVTGLAFAIDRYHTWSESAQRSESNEVLLEKEVSRRDSLEEEVKKIKLSFAQIANSEDSELNTSNCLELLINEEQHRSFVNYMLVNNPDSKEILCQFCNK